MDKTDVNNVNPAYLSDLIKQAREISLATLNDGKWHTDAFLCLCMSEILGDKVPDSNVDEYIDTSKDYFVEYMQSRTISSLDRYITQVCMIVSEVHHNCEAEEKQLIKNKIENLLKVL